MVQILPANVFAYAAARPDQNSGCSRQTGTGPRPTSLVVGAVQAPVIFLVNHLDVLPVGQHCRQLRLGRRS